MQKLLQPWLIGIQALKLCPLLICGCSFSPSILVSINVFEDVWAFSNSCGKRCSEWGPPIREINLYLLEIFSAIPFCCIMHPHRTSSISGFLFLKERNFPSLLSTFSSAFSHSTGIDNEHISVFFTVGRNISHGFKISEMLRNRRHSSDNHKSIYSIFGPSTCPFTSINLL